MFYYKSKQNSFHLEAKEGDFLLVSNSSETAKNQKEKKSKMNKTSIVLLPENLRAYFELSAQAWILYKAP